MARLWQRIQRAIEDERYYVSVHADNQLVERGIEPWHLVSEARTAKLVYERADTKPNPTVVVRQLLPSGEELELVWAWSAESKQALLVTTYVAD
jgi:hypothetical protein